MIGWIILGVILISAIIDTLIGNWYWPGKEGIIKEGKYYYLYKYNRLLLIPIKFWWSLDRRYDTGSVGLLDWNFSSKNYFYKEQEALRYTTRSRKNKRRGISDDQEEVWTSKDKKLAKKEDYSHLLEGVTDPQERLVLESVIERITA